MLNRKHLTEKQISEALDYLQHVRNNNQKKRLHRTASIVKELKAQNRKYFWSGINTIYLQFSPSENVNLKIYINADLYCYRVRYDIHVGKNHEFAIQEIEANNGNQLLWELVCMQWLDKSFLPTTKQIQIL